MFITRIFICSEWGSVRRRKRHDTSDSGSALGSPRKREGGSLPCDVARGSNKTVKPDELVLTSTDYIHTESSRLTNDCIINMEGTESSASFSESEDKFPDRWNNHRIRRTEHTSTTSKQLVATPVEALIQLFSNCRRYRTNGRGYGDLPV